MHYYEVAPTQIIRNNSATFTYAYEHSLSVGHIVTIEVGKKVLVGVVIRVVTMPDYDTKQISSIVDQVPLPTPLVTSALWMSEYYKSHLATVLQTVLPRGLLKTRRARSVTKRQSGRERTINVLTPDQQAAVTTIEDSSPGSILLHGITGSGKTTVYIHAAQRALDDGKSVIILVPEIALTSQLVDEFAHHFDDIILTHSRQTEAERHLSWLDALHSNSPRVAIGPRSALFLPLRSIGVIIIDEAHEPSFKQEQSPRYSALRAASILAKHHVGKVILGSATPLIADYYIAQASGRPVIEMNNKARLDTTQPTVQLVDMTKRTSFKQHRFLSDPLIAQLNTTFENGNQALIFHNRRGSASTTLCENCGWAASCPRCFIPLTLHADHHHLRCHVCGMTEKVPTSCPTCHHADIIHKGIGTKLIESEIRKLFPDKIIARFDGDNDKEETVESKYNDLYSGHIDLIIGTQVIAKGLDLPKLRTVGVIQADAGLSLPDYSSSERTFQLLAQVVGRVGRSHHQTSVIIQSYQPTNVAVVDGIAQDYGHFYQQALLLRQQGHFPPFAYLLKLTCIYKSEAAAVRNAQQLARLLRQKGSSDISILGPTPSFYERQRDTYRWQLVVKSPRRGALVELLDHVPAQHWQSELDPLSLL